MHYRVLTHTLPPLRERYEIGQYWRSGRWRQGGVAPGKAALLWAAANQSILADMLYVLQEAWPASRAQLRDASQISDAVL